MTGIKYAHAPVGKECDVVFAKEREQFLLASANNGVIVSLIYTGLHVILLFRYLENLLHLSYRVVGDAKILKLPLTIGIINCLEGVLGWVIGRCVEVLVATGVERVD